MSHLGVAERGRHGEQTHGDEDERRHDARALHCAQLLGARRVTHGDVPAIRISFRVTTTGTS